MSTTNIGADDALWLDGNALAGPLSEVIGTDLTVAELTCAGCRTTGPRRRASLLNPPLWVSPLGA